MGMRLGFLHGTGPARATGSASRLSRMTGSTQRLSVLSTPVDRRRAGRVNGRRPDRTLSASSSLAHAVEAVLRHSGGDCIRRPRTGGDIRHRHMDSRQLDLKIGGKDAGANPRDRARRLQSCRCRSNPCEDKHETHHRYRHNRTLLSSPRRPERLRRNGCGDRRAGVSSRPSTFQLATARQAEILVGFDPRNVVRRESLCVFD